MTKQEFLNLLAEEKAANAKLIEFYDQHTEQSVKALKECGGEATSDFGENGKSCIWYALDKEQTNFISGVLNTVKHPEVGNQILSRDKEHRRLVAEYCKSQKRILEAIGFDVECAIPGTLIEVKNAIRKTVEVMSCED